MAKFIHGHCRRPASGNRVHSPEYRAYTAMKNRVLNPNQARFKDYGGRGITICSRWLHGEAGLTGFQCFLHDLGPKPSHAHSIERKSNEVGYEPWNVKWATRVEQARNTRNVRFVDLCDHPLPLVEVVERWGAVSYQTAVMRLHRGWGELEAVLTPVGAPPGSAYVEMWPAFLSDQQAT